MHLLTPLIRTSRAVGAAALLLGSTSCSFFETKEVADPNNVSLESVINNPTPVQINALATGTEASMRLGHTGRAPYNWLTGTFGREIIVLATSDPRYYTELLGAGGASLDPAGFYTDAYTQFGRSHRAAQILVQSAETANSGVLSDAQKQGVRGFAHTVQASAKLHLLNLQYKNGIRIDLADYTRPGKFVTYELALANIKQLLDQAATELDGAGPSFAFPLSAGYNGFDTPPTYKQFNRALAARVALYRKDFPGALAELRGSFRDTTAALTIGPKILFNPAGANNVPNPYFQEPNSPVSTLVVVQRSYLLDAIADGTAALLGRKKTPTVRDSLAGDRRIVNKIGVRKESRSLGSPPVTGEFEALLFKTQADPLDIIRNEELILISAEAKIQTGDLTGAVADLNVIRTKAGGLPRYRGPSTLR